MRGQLGRGIIFVVALAALVLMLGPRERVGILPEPMVPSGDTPEETVGTVLRAEAFVPDLRPGVEKEVVWAEPDRRRTQVAVVYVHGFAATKEELRPLPDEVAAALGANLFFTRLAGHGATGEALGQARAADWMLDISEALEVGRALGRQVLVIASSTGASLAAIAAAEPGGQERVAGYVLISPNFGLRATGAHLLAAPFARELAPTLMGETQALDPASEEQARWWTVEFPTEALVPVAAVAEAAYLTIYEGVTAPALFVVSDEDAVVYAYRAREVAERWGAGARVVELTPGPRDDPSAHVLAGRIMSPDLTPTVLRAVLDWIAEQGIGAAPPQ